MATVGKRNRSVLLIVDTQIGVMSEVWDGPRITANVQEAVERARGAGVPVIWVQHSDDEELPYGSPEWEWVPELQPRADETVVHKQFNSAFENTTLEEVLGREKATHIVLAGCATNWCIRATAYGALDRGYDVTLIADGHSTTPMELANRPAIEAKDIIDDLNVTLNYLSYPDRTNDVVKASDLAF